jgi:hypothetical protein
LTAPPPLTTSRTGCSAPSSRVTKPRWPHCGRMMSSCGAWAAGGNATKPGHSR